MDEAMKASEQVSDEVRRILKRNAGEVKSKALQAIIVKDAMQYVETGQLQYLLGEQRLLEAEQQRLLAQRQTEALVYIQLRLGIIAEMITDICRGGMRKRIAEMESFMLRKRLKGAEMFGDDRLVKHLRLRLRILETLRERLISGADKGDAKKMVSEINYPTTRPYRTRRVRDVRPKYSKRNNNN